MTLHIDDEEERQEDFRLLGDHHHNADIPSTAAVPQAPYMFSDYSLSSLNSQVPFESTEMIDRCKKFPTEKKKPGFLSSFLNRNGKAQQNDVPRVIYIQHLPNLRFLGNQVSTAKYNPFSFLPKFLYVEFSKSANLFFLFISGIQVKEIISFYTLRCSYSNCYIIANP